MKSSTGVAICCSQPYEKGMFPIKIKPLEINESLVGHKFGTATGIVSKERAQTMAGLARCDPMVPAHLEFLKGHGTLQALVINELVNGRNKVATPSDPEDYHEKIADWSKYGFWSGITMNFRKHLVLNEIFIIYMSVGAVYDSHNPEKPDKKGSAVIRFDYRIEQQDEICIDGTMTGMMQNCGNFGGERAPALAVKVPTSGAGPDEDSFRLSQFPGIESDHWLWAINSRDFNPLHLEDAVAAARKLEKPIAIAHGPMLVARSMAAVIKHFCPDDSCRLLKFDVHRIGAPLFRGEDQIVQLSDMGETEIVHNDANRKVRRIVGKLNQFATGSPRRSCLEPFEAYIAV